MITKMPMYCKSFRCIAGKCHDNCCIGWEIDIDSATADYYKSLGGSFGKKLTDNIEENEVPCFRLIDERCPFLNKNNLCDIIINLGEDKLCQICRDHPRYFEWYSDIKEGGIGLCCEEAARLIVTSGEKFSTYDMPCSESGYDGYNKNLYNMLHFARDRIIRTLESDELSLKDRIASVLSYADKIQFMADNCNYSLMPLSVISAPANPKADIRDFLQSFSLLEPIDTKWEDYLNKLIASSDDLAQILLSDNNSFDTYLKNIAVYFIWRYFLKGVFDEEILSKVRLMAVSVAMIKMMYIAEGNPDGEKCSILAKNYSKEIEYSQENLEKIYDMAYENPAFSVENILSLL